MGLADRPYLRPDAAGHHFGAAGRRISVSTWLIIICVAVFVLDTFLPLRWVPTGVWTPAPGVDPSLVERPRLGDRVVESRRDVVDPRTKQVRTVDVRERVLEDRSGKPIGMALLRPMRFIESWGHFSTDELIHGWGWWRVISFQFLHDHSILVHLLFNMMGLWFFGPLVESYLGGKRFLAFYLLCGICGALMYLLLNLLGYVGTQLFGPVFARMPFLLFNDIRTPLIGASAGVFGVLMAGAYLAPRQIVLLFFIIPIRFSVLAYCLVALSLLSLAFSLRNAGGEAAHLGGAIAGFYFIRHPHRLHGFFDILGRVDPTSRSAKARRSGSREAGLPGTREARGRGSAARPGPVRGEEIDRILDKIRVSGMASLTNAERQTLRDAASQ
ncbi:MAG TPA: rhomboid family intramembrane serine protease [Phycisphaerales bacterium]|nr:rhomboid family intramembrane serine protease [Phycisphaerales bacterium]HMP36665.1 rhomboid family intramembrane serine protease [Phycisphaerales bacterium]